MSIIIYNKGDYEKVEDRNFDHYTHLSDETMSIINTLTDQVSAPTYSKTPLFTSSSTNTEKVNKGAPMSSMHTSSNSKFTSPTSSSQVHKSRSNQYNQKSVLTSSNKKITTENNRADEKWRGNKPSFQPTKINRNKEGSEGIINEIRLLLNKLTDKTYKKISEQIVEIVLSIESNDTKKEITEQIINVACVNSINSKSYATLLYEINNQLEVDKGNCIQNLLQSYSKSYSELIGVSTSPDDDYDKFCEMNLCNNKRKGTTQFFCYLSEKNLVSNTQMSNLFEELTSLLTAQIQSANSLMCNEELTDNLFVMSKYILNNAKTSQDSIFHLILSHDFSFYTKKKYEGISQKAKFKIMDIMDIIKKQ